MSTSVKSINPLMNYISVQKAGNTPENSSGSFTDAFGKASEHADIGNEAYKNDNISKNPRVKVNHTDKKGLYNSNETARTERSRNGDGNVTAQDAVRDTGEVLAEKVAQELGLPMEAVVKAMEVLGLTMTDLLNPDNMTQLVLSLENADMLTLMTDEGLYNSLKNLLDAVDEAIGALQESGLTQEDIAAVMERAVSEKAAPGVLSGAKGQEISGDQKGYTVTVEQDGEVVEISVKADGSGETESPELISKGIQAPEQEEESAGNKKDNSSQKDSSSQGNSNTSTNILLENLLNRGNVPKADTVFDNTLAGQTSGTQNIMNQIMDYMKIQVKADLTQMEIQLHPASLGTVNINISSKDGVITAQFLTQNEAVKAAIESQLVQLKNSFDEQGIKVEAVEVAVESHGFERNLSGGESAKEQAKDGRKKGIRKINLNELDSADEEQLDEEEQIAVAMMAADGNSVDYTA